MLGIGQGAEAWWRQGPEAAGVQGGGRGGRGQIEAGGKLLGLGPPSLPAPPAAVSGGGIN